MNKKRRIGIPDLDIPGTARPVEECPSTNVASGSIKHIYCFLLGIAVNIPENAIEALRRNPNVTAVEPDGLFHKTAEPLN